jgi:hypothetical protein
LVTFDELLNIEESLSETQESGKEVFIYSIYKDNDFDNKPEVKRVYDKNINAGVVYYDIYYGETVISPDKGYISEENQIKLSDLFTNGTLWESKYKQRFTEKTFSDDFLDYQLYKTSSFDMMIYKWDNERIEGYFCVNFPIKERCPNRTRKKGCNNQCSRDTTNLFYKKMPNHIAKELYDNLVEWKNIKNEIENGNSK